MTTSSFNEKPKPQSLLELSKISGCKIRQCANTAKIFKNIATLTEATKNDISFFDNRSYFLHYKKSKAGACVVRPEDVGSAPRNMALLVTSSPYSAYALITDAFYPNQPIKDAIHPSAVVHPKAKVGKNCYIAPHVVISKKAKIGKSCFIESGTYIGPSVIIGNNCYIGAASTITYCVVGDDVIIHSGARIGQDGFGFAVHKGRNIKVKQLGAVRISKHVEIGANTTIDRGAISDTVIGEGTKIDNLVQIAHNVQIGKDCFIAAQVGISGSAKVGNRVAIGGQSGVAGHLKIGDGVQIAGKTGVTKSIKANQTVAGFPAIPIRDWRRGVSLVSKLVKQTNKEKK